jgi:hypothetical protein
MLIRNSDKIDVTGMPLRDPGFEVLTVVTKKNGLVWDMTPFISVVSLPTF